MLGTRARATPMLRITTQHAPQVLTFRLEGQLTGPWVRVLEECWERALAGPVGPVRRVDVTGMTSVDAAGEALLASLHRQGADLVAADCLTKALVAEITRESPPDPVPPGRRADPRPLPPRGTL
jgi:ABC-type transporter Mla MlaB component